MAGEVVGGTLGGREPGGADVGSRATFTTPAGLASTGRKAPPPSPLSSTTPDKLTHKKGTDGVGGGPGAVRKGFWLTPSWLLGCRPPPPPRRGGGRRVPSVLRKALGGGHAVQHREQLQAVAVQKGAA